ncbi:MAG: NrfD/PsrC family molybdoenzyme membrane anchor subunit, partial [Ktedonobacteraceae bacterium]
RLLAALPQTFLAIPGSALGVFLGGYTGVLLTATSIPLWSRSKVLGAIFIASAISTSSALISFVLHLTHTSDRVLHKLERLEWIALLIEMVGLFTFLRGAGRAARPLVGTGPSEHGRTFWSFVAGTGLLLPWILQTLSLLTGRSSKHRSRRGMVISLFVLVGGYFLRRTMIEAGHTSSADARTTLWNAKR